MRHIGERFPVVFKNLGVAGTALIPLIPVKNTDEFSSLKCFRVFLWLVLLVLSSKGPLFGLSRL